MICSLKTGISITLLGLCLLLSSQSLWAQKKADDQTIKIALLPIIDSLPFYVAETEGLFKRQGVKVKVMPVASGLDRDQLMQAGVIDGMLNEMMSTANFNRNRSVVKVVMMIRSAQSDYPMFRLLAGPGSGINSTMDLAGKAIGISKNTVIEYVTDRWLAAEGLQANQIVKKSIPAIPERFQLLMQKQLPAVVLPDPLAKAAMVAGARLIIDDSRYSSYSVSVLSFSAHSLETKSRQVRGFLKAWDQAASAINKSPESFRKVMLKKIRVPGNVKNTYAIPAFSRRQVPDQKQWRDVMDWMVARGLIKSPLSYSGSVTSKYLP